MTWISALVDVEACWPSIQWAQYYSTAQEAWNACKQYEWMEWALDRFPFDTGPLLSAAKAKLDDAGILAEDCQYDPFDPLKSLGYYYSVKRIPNMVYWLSVIDGKVDSCDYVRKFFPKVPVYEP